MRCWGSLAFVVVAGCGPLPSEHRSPGPVPSATTTSPPVDPWQAQAVSIPGVTHHTERCVVADGWAAAEAWARAFRMPLERTPGKGSELPRVGLEPLVVQGETGVEARAYRQVARYVVAGRSVLRRFIMRRSDTTVMGCLVDERVYRDGTTDTSSWYWAPLGNGQLELTTRAPVSHAGTKEVDLSTVKHRCTTRAGQLSCITGVESARIEVRGNRWAIAHLVRFGSARPYVVPLEPGVSLTAADLGDETHATMHGRALLVGSAPAPSPSTRRRVDGTGLPPIVGRGPCIQVTASNPTAAAEAWDDETETLGIRLQAPFLWADSVLDGPHHSRRQVLGTLDDDHPVEMYVSGSKIDHSARGGQFVFAAQPSGVSGCALSIGSVRYRYVDGSFAKQGGGFSFRLTTASTLVGALSGATKEVREVRCLLSTNGMGCASWPLTWSASAGPSFDASSRPTSATEKASVTGSTPRVTWTARKRSFQLELAVGRSVRIPLSTAGVITAPQAVEVRSTLFRP